MVRLYGFRDIYDDKTVRLKGIHVRREAILRQLLTISGIFDRYMKRTTNMKYLRTLKNKAKEQPDAEQIKWQSGTMTCAYLMPTAKQLVKQNLGGAFLERETGLRSVIIKYQELRIAGFHTIDVLDGRDDSPMKGRRSPDVCACWAPLLPPDTDLYL